MMELVDSARTLIIAYGVSVLGGILILIAGWIVLNYPLTAERHAEIREALDARDLAEAAPEFGAKPKTAEEIHAVSRPAE